MLKIAYFGSDLFSLVSFSEILKLRDAKPHLISDLKLITRQLKVSGRGMKNIIKPRIVEYAEARGIAWHQVESPGEFSELSGDCNLAVAVSYGMLIPASFLADLTFGGLNVHPSLLPQYRGASPLQYAILDQCRYSGVSVQTLHPTKFDHGKVLWQSNPVELKDRETRLSLSEKLAKLGARGLVSTLERAALPEFVGFDSVDGCTLHAKPSLAPIIDRSMHKIDFAMSAKAVDARGRALEKLFFEQNVEQKRPKRGKPKGLPVLRVNLSDFRSVNSAKIDSSHLPGFIGDLCLGESPEGIPLLCLKLKDGFLGAAEVTVQGFKTESASAYFAARDSRRLKEVHVN